MQKFTSDDPELAEIRAGLQKPVYPIGEIIKDGPYGRTTIYRDVATGRLTTFVSRGRRFALAIDYARYLLDLKREGAVGVISTDRSRAARDRRRAEGRTS